MTDHKQHIITGLVVAALTLGACSATPTSSVPTSNTTVQGQEATAVNQNSEGRYQLFTPEVLASSSDTRRVLFFYASWCPTCRPADAEFQAQAAQIPEDVTLIRVNYNDPDTDQTEKDLAQKYAVTYQHTYVQIDENGEEIAKWNGGQLEELLTNLK